MATHLKTTRDVICMKIFIDIVGYCGGTILGIQLIPQIYKIYITKSTKDISGMFLQMNILGLGLMTAYGVLKDAKPLYIPTSFSLFSTIIMYSMTVIYQSPQNNEVIIHTCRKEDGRCPCPC